ncbi:hypothetical protein [Providencia huaxiensis]|uniref:hypothetical protein n=1 Tax=Providencia huaxiensis TaxID=2027290 RepID=UPI001EFE4187|nr:hypothetical protein [Providencia huaxiensis]MCG9537396.1 hypothetical protein [Providencia huaxiensis]
MMVTKAQLLEQISVEVSFDQDLICACNSILDYICISEKDNLKHLPIYKINKIIKNKESSFTFNVINFLSGEQFPIFNVCFEFVDGDFIEQVDHETLVYSQINNVYYHPETGESVQDYESKIFMYLSLSDFGREIICN